MQVANRGFANVLTMTFPAAAHLEEQRARAYQGFLQLIERAKATGRLRPDFTDQAMVILLMAGERLLAGRATSPCTAAIGGLSWPPEPRTGSCPRVGVLRRHEMQPMVAQCRLPG
ncbi:hypothetical protein [Planomonospora venezuelensis]